MIVKRLTLVQQFALRSLVFVVVMALLLGLTMSFAVRQLFVSVSARTAQVTGNTTVIHHIGNQDISAYPLDPEIRDELDHMMDQDLQDTGITAIKLWNTSGVLMYSSDGDHEGESFEGHESLDAALAGEVTVEVAPKAREENEAQIESTGRVLEVYAPLTRDGETIGVFEIYQEYAPVEDSINRFLGLMWLIIIGGSVPAYFLQLTLVKRTADELMSVKGSLAEVNRRLRDSLEDMEMHSLGTLQALVAAVDAKDSYTARHSIAVTDYAVAIARRMGLSEDEISGVERAGLLHDIGKIGTPESILLKPERLDEDEFSVMCEHSSMGGHIVEAVPFLAGLTPIIRGHHERWDGSGYPDGLAGERIPLLARILSVADAFDAMTSDRPYRSPISFEVARAELVRCAGSQFDTDVVKSLIEALDAGDATVVVHTEAARVKRRRVPFDTTDAG